MTQAAEPHNIAVKRALSSLAAADARFTPSEDILVVRVLSAPEHTGASLT